MTTANIIRALERLQLTEKLLVVERTIQHIRSQKEHLLKSGVETLYDDYKNDNELAACTLLDQESFYEAR